MTWPRSKLRGVFWLSSEGKKTTPAGKFPGRGCADSVQVPGRFSAVVPAAEHRRECLDLFLAPALLARLFVITLGADALDDVLAVEFLLHPAERAINRLVLANLDFDGHGFADVVWERKGSLGFPRKPTSNRFFPKRHRQRHPALLKVFPPEELPPPPTSPGRHLAGISRRLLAAGIDGGLGLGGSDERGNTSGKAGRLV